MSYMEYYTCSLDPPQQHKVPVSAIVMALWFNLVDLHEEHMGKITAHHSINAAPFQSKGLILDESKGHLSTRCSLWVFWRQPLTSLVGTGDWSVEDPDIRSQFLTPWVRTRNKVTVTLNCVCNLSYHGELTARHCTTNGLSLSHMYKLL